MSASVNKVILIGNIGRKPEEKNGAAVFSLATSKKYTNKAGDRVDQTTWHNIKVIGKGAKFVLDQLDKGEPVYVEGEINNYEYTAQDGEKKRYSEVVTFMVLWLGGSVRPSGESYYEPDPNPAR